MFHGTTGRVKGITKIRDAGRVVYLLLMLGIIGCTPKLIGPTAPSNYHFVVFTPPGVIVGNREDIIVRLQDAQGQQVSGVTVRFQVAPSWANHASVMPAEVITQAGQTRVTFQGDTTGNVPVSVQVENLSFEMTIDVDVRPSRPSGA